MDKLNIYQRIEAVKSQVIRLGKDATVGTGNSKYSALTHDKVTRAIKKPMLDVGLVSYIQDIEYSTTHSEYTDQYKKLKFKHFCEVKIKVVYICSDDPTSFIVVESIGHGEDFGDKAPGKAVSYATKYANLKTFDIETGENDEIRIDNLQQWSIEEQLQACSSMEVLGNFWHSLSPNNQNTQSIINAKEKRKEELSCQQQ